MLFTHVDEKICQIFIGQLKTFFKENLSNVNLIVKRDRQRKRTYRRFVQNLIVPRSFARKFLGPFIGPNQVIYPFQAIFLLLEAF